MAHLSGPGVSRRAATASNGGSRDLNWPPAPAPLPVPVVDNHCHLEIEDGGTGLSLDEQIGRASEVGVTRVVQIGCNVRAATWTVTHALQHPQVLGGVALHPNDAARLHEREGQAALRTALDQVRELARHPRVRTISETGLDYFRTREPRGHEVQKWVFREHIALAKELDLPLQIHCRDAYGDVLEILLADGAPPRTVFHCFAADAEFAALASARGWYCSFSGTVTFDKNDQLRAAARVVAPSQLLVETDAPFLTPVPYRGRPNAPYVMGYTVRALAQITGRELSGLCAQISHTCEELYGPWEL